MSPFKDYIGDSVYADYDGYHIILTTENGYGASNTIALEPNVLEALSRYQEWLAAKLEEQRKELSGDQTEPLQPL